MKYLVFSCQFCDKQKRILKSKRGNYGLKFCSRACANLSFKKIFSFTCQFCHKTRPVFEEGYKFSRRKYCDKICAGEATRRFPAVDKKKYIRAIKMLGFSCQIRGKQVPLRGIEDSALRIAMAYGDAVERIARYFGIKRVYSV